MKNLVLGSRSVRTCLSILMAFAILIQVVLPVSASTGSWTGTGSMHTGRWLHTATLLSDGRVLVAGGVSPSGVTASAELFDPNTGLWTVTGSMNYARHVHTATLLPNGKVLVVGGLNVNSLGSAELYDPQTGLWTITNSLNVARREHTATLLDNGKVLIAGGYDGSQYLKSAELYDPSIGFWSFTGSMNFARTVHTQTLLENGKVLVAGGEGSGGYLSSAELYNPTTGIWTSTSSMHSAHCNHTATLLSDGLVLIAGHATDSNSEIFDLNTGTWTVKASMHDIRRNSESVLLPDGKVLVAGGSIWGDPPGTSYSVELFDPDTNTWSYAPSMNYRRGLAASTMLKDGRFLISGGDPNGSSISAELYKGPLFVSVEQSVGQSDPTNTIPIDFTVTFTQPVTGFGESDVDFTGSTTPGTLTASISGSGATYTVSVSGMTGDGIVAVSIPAGVAQDSEGNLNNQSTSTDNTVAYDVTPPDTNMASTPASVNNETRAEFAFSSPEDTAVFECAIDEDEYGTCISPLIYLDLLEGDHLFQVHAKDLAGNVDLSPATYTWEIDLTEPDTAIDSNPDNLTNSRTADFEFSSAEIGAIFECSLDTDPFSPCANPKTYTNLTEGEHNFSVRAIDLATNVDQTPATYTWVVDLTPPDTSIDSHPPSPINSSTANFTFSSQDTTAIFECSLDSTEYDLCVSPASYSDLSQGSHVFFVRAVDLAGNLDPSPAFYFWIVVYNPVPTITNINPSSILIGSDQFVLTVTGSNFMDGSEIYWGTSTLETDFISQTELRAPVPSELLQIAGPVSIKVVNPGPGGGNSNSVAFLVLEYKVYLPVVSSQTTSKLMEIFTWKELVTGGLEACAEREPILLAFLHTFLR